MSSLRRESHPFVGEETRFRVELANIIPLGEQYSLREVDTGRLFYVFETLPVEWRFEDVNEDGLDDIVYIVPMKPPRSVNARCGFAVRIAYGIGDGIFRYAETTKLFDGRA